uniref:Translin n=1 Tax=Strigamia maritima TaxID=126957 RepID=T1JBZ9_STRMM
MAKQITEIFQSYQEYINAEQDLREEIRVVVRELEHTSREILAVIQMIHQDQGPDKLPLVCAQARDLFEKAKNKYKELSDKIPKEQYYRFHDHWRFANQRFVFLVATVVYLEHERLVTREEIADILGLSVRSDDGFHLELDDYLMGLLSLASELSRFTVNSVTSGDYARPLRISKFMNELNAGFRLLNLKNDGLRKRYDSLKYEIKKVEEVVYDLSIRGLKPKCVEEGVDVEVAKEM